MSDISWDQIGPYLAAGAAFVVIGLAYFWQRRRRFAEMLDVDLSLYRFGAHSLEGSILVTNASRTLIMIESLTIEHPENVMFHLAPGRTDDLATRLQGRRLTTVKVLKPLPPGATREVNLILDELGPDTRKAKEIVINVEYTVLGRHKSRRRLSLYHPMPAGSQGGLIHA